MIHELIGNISKILLVLGTVFLITKLVNKRLGDKPDSTIGIRKYSISCM